VSGDEQGHTGEATRQAILPQMPHGWTTVCNWCECVIVNAQAHATVCPSRPNRTAEVSP